MDKEWCLNKLAEDYAVPLDMPEVREVVEDWLDEFLAAHEQDKADALKVQDETWRDIVDEKLDEIASLKARMAVMADALRAIRDATGKAWKADFEARTKGVNADGQIDMLIEAIGGCSETADQALESAPQVLFHGTLGDDGWDRDGFFDAMAKPPVDVLILARLEQAGEEESDV